MIIDFHTHAFPGAIRDNREHYFGGEPAFRLLYESPKSKLVGARDTIGMMDDQGVDRSVIFGFPWKDPETFRRNNDYIMEAVARDPKRLVGFSCFDAFAADAARETERCLSGGLAGVGELAFYRSGIDGEALDRLTPVMEICRTRNVSILIHTNEPVGHLYPGKTPNTLKQIYDLVRRFPDNRIVLAHWGGGIFLYSLLKKEVAGSLENVWFDTAASPFLYHPDIYRYARDLAGIDKILFGSDFPLLKPKRYFRELEASGLTRDEMDAVCGGNAARLLNIAEAPAT